MTLFRHGGLLDEAADEGFGGFALVGAKEALEDHAVGQDEWGEALTSSDTNSNNAQ